MVTMETKLVSIGFQAIAVVVSRILNFYQQRDNLSISRIPFGMFYMK